MKMQSSNTKQKYVHHHRIISSEIIHIKNKHSNQSLSKQIQQAMINHCKTLKIINLPENKPEIPQPILNLIYPQLIQLNLSGNYIGKRPLLNLPKIRNLNLSKTLLQQLHILQSLPYLQILNLSSNFITQFPLIKAPNLIKLYLNQNQIHNVQKISFFQHEYKSLQILTLNNNRLRGDFPAINCHKLQQLDISFNFQLFSIHKFCQKQFINMKILIIQNIDKWSNSQYQYLQYLPQMLMPKLQTLIISHAHLSDIQDFSKGVYPQLKTFEISSNYMQLTLHQLNAPNLKNICFQSTKVINLSELLKGDYKYLKKISLKDNNSFIYQQLPKLKPKIIEDKQFISEIKNQELSFEQIEFYHMKDCGKEAYQFIKLTQFHYSFYKELLTPFVCNIKVLRLNLKVINSIEILFHIDIKKITYIQIMQNHYLSSTYKKLTKINILDLHFSNLKTFQINEYQQPNIITFFDKKIQSINRKMQGRINIERNEYWRRMVSGKKQINWKISYSWKDNPYIREQETYKSFETRLLSLKFKKIKNIDSQ